ncbi:thioredoxin family protein [Candidatus Latescibacterota bacterium]
MTTNVKNIFYVFFSIFLILIICEGNITHAAAVQNMWWDDWDSAMEFARENEKPVIVDFIVVGCPACNKLNEETLSAPEIVERFEDNWVCIRIEIFHKHKNATYDGDTLSYADIPEQFDVMGFPTLLFFDTNGKHTFSLPGYINKKLFGQILDCVKAGDIETGIELVNARHYGLTKLFGSMSALLVGVSMIVIVIGIIMFEKKQTR